MKKIIVFTLICLPLFCLAQNSPTFYLTKQPWRLSADEMSGIGKHEAMQKNTQIEFLKDGSWKASAPWNGDSKGKWSLVNENKTLLVSFSKEDKHFLIQLLNENELQLKHTTKIATYKLTLLASNK
ncbi:MAG: hypothetical protein JST69_00985 [Bacteroidetes bacterium]|nr:hypothetical protein [Bacteroidota bacterium]